MAVAEVDVSRLKDDIVRLAGVKYGLDKSDEERIAIRAKVDELESLQKVETCDLTGTAWRTVYTTSTGNSSGKLGPFIGKVRQLFPAELTGKYTNNVEFGPLKLSLLGRYEKVNDRRIKVEFEHTDFILGPFKVRKRVNE